MKSRVLVTGGAGVVGSHLVDALAARGFRVRVVDALVPQVHGRARRPKYLPDGVEFIKADVRRPETWRKALKGIKVLFHQAADLSAALVNGRHDHV